MLLKYCIYFTNVMFTCLNTMKLSVYQAEYYVYLAIHYHNEAV